MKRIHTLIRLMLVVVMAAAFCAQCTKKNDDMEKLDKELDQIISKDEKPAEKKPKKEEKKKMPEPEKKELEPLDKVKAQLKPGMYAVFDTTMGRIICELYPDKTPNGVANFVGLAEGTKEWTDPKTGEKVKRPFYDGLIFHRVIPGFMIQGGDPLGTGTGDPGYKVADEFSPDLTFDQPGRLAYANAGPNTNGSQFFITHTPTPHLNGKHPILGQVIQGQSVVDAIGDVDTGPNDKPLTPVVMEKVTILRVEAGAK